AQKGGKRLTSCVKRWWGNRQLWVLSQHATSGNLINVISYQILLRQAHSSNWKSLKVCKPEQKILCS
ncbi:unnamed protein product, partial [Bubo scandiacus]